MYCPLCSMELKLISDDDSRGIESYECPECGFEGEYDALTGRWEE